jgi:hypothetical protein
MSDPPSTQTRSRLPSKTSSQPPENGPMTNKLDLRTKLPPTLTPLVLVILEASLHSLVSGLIERGV